MITSLILWFQHVWAALSAVIARDWPYYLIALPVVAVIAWFTTPGDDLQTADEEDDTRYWRATSME